MSDKGVPITDATVTFAVRLPSDSIPQARGQALPGSFPQHGAVVLRIPAGTDGSFSAGAPAIGNYVACAQSTAGPYLDTCLWEPALNQVQVAAATIAPLRLVMRTGAILSIHVSDSSGALAGGTAVQPRDLALSVGPASGPSMPMTMVAATAAGRDYRAVIPFDTTVNVCVGGVGVRVGDSSGNAFPGGSAVIPVLVSSAAATTSAQLTINVLGAR